MFTERNIRKSQAIVINIIDSCNFLIEIILWHYQDLEIGAIGVIIFSFFYTVRKPSHLTTQWHSNKINLCAEFVINNLIVGLC